jgi:signal peptidase I
MSDPHVTPDPPTGTAARAPQEQPTSAPLTTPRPRHRTRWLLNIFLLLGLGLTGALGAGLLVALGMTTAALVVLGGAVLIGLAVAARPLFDNGRLRFLRTLALAAILLAFLAAGAVASYVLFFRAYVVPTGAMALAVPGYHKDVTCPRCGHEFAINSSVELDDDPALPRRIAITGCACANCRFPIDFAADNATPTARSGSRILAARFLGNPPADESLRLAVVTFDYPATPPGEPGRRYVERVVGLPGETVAISGGRLYRSTAVRHEDEPGDPLERWRPEFMHVNDPKAEELFREGKFEIIRKPPEVMLALRRLVYDHDHPATDLKETTRWAAEDRDGWVAQGQAFHSAAGDGKAIRWLRYRHLLRPNPQKAGGAPETRPQLIRDFFAYNSFVTDNMPHQPAEGRNWVGDLMLECNLQVRRRRGNSGWN